MERRHVIGIVDDNDSVRQSMELLVEASGYKAEAFNCAEDFIESGNCDRFDCLIFDFSLPGLTGLQLIDYIDEKHNRPPTIIVSGTIDGEKMQKLLATGVVAVVSKPARGQELMKLVSIAVNSDRG